MFGFISGTCGAHGGRTGKPLGLEQRRRSVIKAICSAMTFHWIVNSEYKIEWIQLSSILCGPLWSMRAAHVQVPNEYACWQTVNNGKSMQWLVCTASRTTTTTTCQIQLNYRCTYTAKFAVRPLSHIESEECAMCMHHTHTPECTNNHVLNGTIRVPLLCWRAHRGREWECKYTDRRRSANDESKS